MITKKIILDVETSRYRVLAGRQGENGVTSVQIDCTDYIAMYGDGSATLMLKNPGENKPYAASLVRDGNFINWVVGSESTITSGRGQAVLIWYPDSGGDAKTADIEFCVESSSINETAIPLMDLINLLNDKLKILTEAGIDPDALKADMRTEIYKFFEENPVQGLEEDYVNGLIEEFVNALACQEINNHVAIKKVELDTYTNSKHGELDDYLDGLKATLPEDFSQINAGLSEVQNKNKTAPVGKVWGTTNDGAGWVDAPQGGTSGMTQTQADARYVQKVSGKGLSTNDYDATAKAKVDAIPSDLDDSLSELDSKFSESIAEIENRYVTKSNSVNLLMLEDGIYKPYNDPDYEVAKVTIKNQNAKIDALVAGANKSISIAYVTLESGTYTFKIFGNDLPTNHLGYVEIYDNNESIASVALIKTVGKNTVFTLSERKTLDVRVNLNSKNVTGSTTINAMIVKGQDVPSEWEKYGAVLIDKGASDEINKLSSELIAVNQTPTENTKLAVEIQEGGSVNFKVRDGDELKDISLLIGGNGGMSETADYWEYPFDNDCEVLTDYWCNGNGVIQATQSGYLCVIITSVNGGDKFYINDRVVNNCICFDATGTMLSNGSDNYYNVDTLARVYTIPNGTVKVVFNVRKTKTHGECSILIAKIKKEKVLCIGDSITYLDNMSGYDNATCFSGWQKELVKNGYEVMSAGFSGHTYAVTDNAQSIYTKIVTDGYDVSGYDKIIMFGGTNDDMYEVEIGNAPSVYLDRDFDVSTTCGAISGIIEYIRNNNHDAEIYLASMPKAKSKSRPFKESMRYRNAIKECAVFFGCNFIDIYTSCNVTPTYGSYADYFYDDVHPNKKGMSRIGKIMVKALMYGYNSGVDSCGVSEDELNEIVAERITSFLDAITIKEGADFNE